MLSIIRQLLQTLTTRLCERSDPQKQTSGRNRNRRQAGMTLIEIMIVLAIVALAMGAAAYGGFRALERARKKTTVETMINIQNAITEWQTDETSACPPALSDLVAKKYLTKEPLDGWNQPFAYKCPGEHDNVADLVSSGADRKMGTEDDVKSWEQR